MNFKVKKNIFRTWLIQNVSMVWVCIQISPKWSTSNEQRSFIMANERDLWLFRFVTSGRRDFVHVTHVTCWYANRFVTDPSLTIILRLYNVLMWMSTSPLYISISLNHSLYTMHMFIKVYAVCSPLMGQLFCPGRKWISDGRNPLPNSVIWQDLR